MANYNQPNYGVMNTGYVGAPIPQTQPMNQITQTMPTPTSYTLQIVNRREEASTSWVPPGYTTVFLNFNDNEMYIKSNNLNNIPSQLRTFVFSEHVEPTPQPNTNGVSREEFNELKSLILASMKSNSPQPIEEDRIPEKEERPYRKQNYKGGSKR